MKIMKGPFKISFCHALAVILMQFVAVCRILFCESLRIFLFCFRLLGTWYYYIMLKFKRCFVIAISQTDSLPVIGISN